MTNDSKTQLGHWEDEDAPHDEEEDRLAWRPPSGESCRTKPEDTRNELAHEATQERAPDFFLSLSNKHATLLYRAF